MITSELNKTSDSSEPKTTSDPTATETTTPTGLSVSEPLPVYFKENHEWDVGILKAPNCPDVDVIRLIKSSPFNSDLRQYIRSHMKNQNATNEGVFFLIGLYDPLDQAIAHKRFVFTSIYILMKNPIFERLQSGEPSWKKKCTNSMISSLAISSIRIEISHSKHLLHINTSMNSV